MAMQKYSVQEWELHGIHLYGREKRYWNFQCSNCYSVQSVEDILKAGFPPNMAYSYCQNCHHKAKQGTDGKGKIIKVNQDLHVEIFDFA